jgi:hypothetical protein
VHRRGHVGPEHHPHAVRLEEAPDDQRLSLIPDAGGLLEVTVWRRVGRPPTEGDHPAPHSLPTMSRA